METFQLSSPSWNIERETGYQPMTTFWEDFSIADKFGAVAILDTFDRAFGEWHDNYKYVTELSLVLNHKIWQHHGQGNDYLAKAYDRLWCTLDTWCNEHLTGEAARYYFETVD